MYKIEVTYEKNMNDTYETTIECVESDEGWDKEIFRYIGWGVMQITSKKENESNSLSEAKEWVKKKINKAKELINSRRKEIIETETIEI